MADLTPGTEFAGHRIEGVAGRGGMGTVYRATHIVLDHEVALKVISGELASDEAFRERFRSESRIAVSLRHPNVVPVHHAGEEDGRLFVTMDLIDGPDLRRLLISGGPMQPARAATLLRQVASALDVAHSRGLVHRDIKPGNVLVEPREGQEPSEHAFLTDFGLAKRFDQASGAALTATGGFVGTLDYVAPEQIKGERVDARTDVYALGCVLYEMLSGRAPFGDREENVSKMYAHLQDEPPWLPGEVHDDLDEVIARALAKEPRERFPSAGDLARAAIAASSGAEETFVERSVARGQAAPETPAANPMPVIDETIESEAPAPAPADTPTSLDEPVTPAPPSPALEATRQDKTPATPPPTPPLEATREDKTPATPQRSQRPAAASPPPSSKEAGRRRLGFLVLGVGAVLAIVAAVLLLGGGGDDDPAIEGDAILVKGFPVGLNIHDNMVSVASRDAGTLTSFSKETREQLGKPVEIGGTVEDVHTGGSFAWVTMPDDGSVAKIALDEKTKVPFGPATPVPVGLDPRGIAGYDGFIWVADMGSEEVSQINPRENDSVTSWPMPAGSLPTDVAFDETENVMWTSDRSGNAIRTPLVGGKQEVFKVGKNPKGIAVLGEFVYIANTDSGTVTRLNLDGSKPTTVEVDGVPRGVAADAERNLIWVANGDDYVTKIDPDDFENPTDVEVSGSPEDVAVGPEKIWVTSGDSDELTSITP